MTGPLEQTDINALASQVERLGSMVDTLSETISSQEATLASVGTALRDRLEPFAEKLDGVFADIEAAEDPLAKTLNTLDGKIGEKSAEIEALLTEVLEAPPVSDALDKFDRAIEAAEAVNEALVGKFATLAALVEEAEEHVLDAVDALKERSTGLSDELLEILSSDAADFANTLAEEVFAPVRTALESLAERLTESATAQVEEILDGQTERIAGDVADALDAVLELLRRSVEQLMDEIAEQLELDTETDRSGRQTLQEALVPLKAALEVLRAAYKVFQSIAGTVGISLPDVD